MVIVIGFLLLVIWVLVSIICLLMDESNGLKKPTVFHKVFYLPIDVIVWIVDKIEEREHRNLIRRLR